MAIEFNCPHCGAPQTAEERYAGLTGPCTVCGKMLSVPGTGITTGQAAAATGGGASVLLIVGVVSLVVLLVCGGVLTALLLPAIQSARTAARRMQSSNNEKQIMLALHNYENMYGTFPPAYIPDENGKPMTSWRVLILPFLEQQPLHAQYDFSKPWDSPENLAVANTMPPTYRSPFETDTTTNNTSYLLFAGQGTVFEDPKAQISFRSFRDGMSQTIALVEVHDTGILWTQPTDLDAAQLDFIIHDMDDAQPGQINSAMPMGTNVGFFDGSVRLISRSINPQVLRSAIDPDDGGPGPGGF